MAIKSERTNSEWVDLPGPAKWWPSITGKPKDAKKDKKAIRWYAKNGFDFSLKDINGYEFALKALGMKDYPLDWVRSLVHEDGELVWDRYRM